MYQLQIISSVRSNNPQIKTSLTIFNYNQIITILSIAWNSNDKIYSIIRRKHRVRIQNSFTHWGLRMMTPCPPGDFSFLVSPICYYFCVLIGCNVIFSEHLCHYLGHQRQWALILICLKTIIIIIQYYYYIRSTLSTMFKYRVY